MNGNSIISVLVCILRVHTFGNWCKGISESSVLFHLLTLLRCELAFTRNVFKRLIDVNVTSRHVEQRTTCIKLCFHAREHVIYGREGDNLLAKLSTFLSIGEGFIISFLFNANALSGNSESSAVHE